MGARQGERPPDDPLREEMKRLAERYGDQEVLRICLWTVQRYADLGARQAMVKRKGDPAIQCETCRERQVLAAQFDRNMAQFKRTTRPLGGAAPSQMEDE